MEKKIGAVGGVLVVLSGLVVTLYGILFGGTATTVIGGVIFVLGVWFTGCMIGE